jgi:predicted class III extradiol MEMO1 family dioxygenase
MAQNGPKIIVRKNGLKELLFLDTKDTDLYDMILETKYDNMMDALEAYAGDAMGDAYVKLIYQKEKVKWDAILRYDTTNNKHKRSRNVFEYCLLQEGLVLEREAAPDGEIKWSLIFRKV